MTGLEDDHLGNVYDPRDNAFNDYFRVLADEPDAVGRVLTSPWRQHMLQWVRDSRIVSNGSIVEVVAPWATADDKLIAPLVDLAVGLAGADIFGLSTLRQPPGAAYQPATGPWQRRTPPRTEMTIPAGPALSPIRPNCSPASS